MTIEKQEAMARLLAGMPYFRNAVDTASKNGTVKLAILSEMPDGSGKIECKFECADFFADIATIIDAPAQTKQDDMTAAATRFLQKHGIK